MTAFLKEMYGFLGNEIFLVLQYWLFLEVDNKESQVLKKGLNVFQIKIALC